LNALKKGFKVYFFGSEHLFFGQLLLCHSLVLAVPWAASVSNSIHSAGVAGFQDFIRFSKAPSIEGYMKEKPAALIFSALTVALLRTSTLICPSASLSANAGT
jgi:hypothetical protein